MSRDRIIQFSACVLALVCLGVSIGLIQPINEQRLDLQLGFNAEVGDQVPPKYVVLAAALGSFLGAPETTVATKPVLLLAPSPGTDRVLGVSFGVSFEASFVLAPWIVRPSKKAERRAPQST